ncbi:signal peptidase I [Saccharicrinis aurantiacus]|uniref:signal peptidase I n=1 Tax=Saccharicrinis aurantiacus TaxID=1849719 RepID=UPI00094FF815|nr:signal peptidase I [Saccharicrinis aurantiacus]
MSNKNILKLITSILLFWVGVWTRSLQPFILILFIGDTVNNSPYYNRIHNFLKTKLDKRVKWAEWGLSLLIGVWIIFFVTDNFIQSYSFQTSSMQGTIKSGDVLLINKLVPGKRLSPNNISEYKRTRGLDNISRKDIIVFNFPEGDTLLIDKPNESYHYLKRLYRLNLSENNSNSFDTKRYYSIEERPLIVSRVLGMPGDSISIIEGLFYANNTMVEYPDSSIGRYQIIDNKEAINNKLIKPYNTLYSSEGFKWEIFQKDYELYKDSITWLKPDINSKNYPEPFIYPFDKHLLWNKDFLGPIYIPQKGSSIEVNNSTIAIYRRVIETYEQNEVEVVNGVIYINGEIQKSYTFKMNYYWVQGDNRSHSFDSRYWGFLPENHIVGKTNFTIASVDHSNRSSGYFRLHRFFKNLE